MTGAFFSGAEGLEVAPQPLLRCPKSSDAPVSVNINGTDYYYVKNLQGDIVALLDGQGSCVVKYTYDAWGKVLSVEDSTETNIGTINPLRYRGYYYDSDLGFYYLRSRYYDPTVGRFLNADDIAYLGANGTVVSHNLFAYCENDVTNHSDPNGTTLVFGGIVLTLTEVIVIAAALAASFAYIFNIGGFRTTVNNAISWSLNRMVTNINTVYNNFRGLNRWAADIIVKVVIKTIAVTATKTLPGIARKYGNLKCKEAANAMKRHLQKTNYQVQLSSYIFHMLIEDMLLANV